MRKINQANVGQVPRGESAGAPRAGWGRRAIGFLYLALGTVLVGIGWLLAENPGIFSAADPRYEPPHACVCLECKHGDARGPNGTLHCAKFPPKELLDARMSASVKRTRLTLGVALGIAGLCFVGLTLACGFPWLLGLWIPEEPTRWYTVARWAAPLVAICCWIAACALKAVYPLTPM